MPDKNWSTKRVTIKDIAKAAGVDQSTVTRALQGSERVKSATREKIVTIANDLGYVPNMAARTLVNRRSRLVGVVIPDMTNPFFADFVKGIEDEAARHDLRILISDTDAAEAAERDAVRLFLELKVDGLLVPMARCPQSYYHDLKSNVPVIHVNRDDAPYHVSCDMVKGSLFIMQHLLGLGHRRIGFVTGPAGPAREPKMFAYHQALEQANLDYDPDLIFSFDGTLNSTEKIADQIIGLSNRPSAVFAWNDVSAIGIIHALRKRELEVPKDISIAGHDDIQLSGSINPPLTTVRWPMYELGQQSIRYLYRLREGQGAGRPSIPTPQLIIRESTAKPGA